MEDNIGQQSGYLGPMETESYVGSRMRDVEILRTTDTNVIARGRRYGRLWFIKGLREEFRASTAMYRRLQKEFEVHSRLRHPNIVQAVGFEEIDGLGLCIVQEWIEGVTLHEALREGSLTASDRRRIMHQLTAAAAYLHRSGVVHRDIKPANVMIRKTGGEAVLIDFGLADSDDYVEIKEPGGTRGFISPEQSESGGVSPADDVYSLGVVMKKLCPTYRTIAERCTGDLQKRPADAGLLLKALDRRDRRPKIILTILAAIIVVSSAVFATWRIIALEKAADTSRQYISALNEQNAGNVNLVANLRDSLDKINDQLSSTRLEMSRVKENEENRQKALKNGYVKVDRILEDYDRRLFSKFTPKDARNYTDAIIELTGKLKDAIKLYSTEVESLPLSKEDKEKITMDIFNYQAIKLGEYQERWLKKIGMEL